MEKLYSINRTNYPVASSRFLNYIEIMGRNRIDWSRIKVKNGMVKSLNSPLYLCMDDIFAIDGSTHPVPRPHPSNWKSRCWKSDRSRLGKGNFRVREWRARIKLAVKFLMISIHFEDS